MLVRITLYVTLGCHSDHRSYACIDNKAAVHEPHPFYVTRHILLTSSLQQENWNLNFKMNKANGTGMGRGYGPLPNTNSE